MGYKTAWEGSAAQYYVPPRRLHTPVNHTKFWVKPKTANLQDISTWLRNNNLILNTKKTEAMIVAKKAPMSSADKW